MSEELIRSGQIRAARALIDWSQLDLAERAGLTQVTIANIENRKTRPSSLTIDKIRSVFEHQGVEFIGNGVRRREHYLNTVVGQDAYLRLLDDAYFTLKDTKGSEVFILGGDERKNYPGVKDSVRRIKGAGIRVRVIIEESNNYIMGDLGDYRQVPSRYFSNAVTLVYGDKFAIVMALDDGLRVHVIRDAHLATAQRGFFEFIWENGDEPTHTTANERY